MTTSTGFPPIANKNATILILGSMPGQKSLDEQQYYAHPRNSFWPIMYKLFNVNEDLNYQRRIQLLNDRKIALWDVLKSCYREGSLDSDIDSSTIEINDFNSFLKDHSKIKSIFFNGAKAEQMFKKEILKNLADYQNLKYFKLPSTSPAHASMTFDQKLQKWKLLKT
jgi:double-stranded uracil-DNA glycosylase